jgi:GNAT superfamily N-acetyltransferase
MTAFTVRPARLDDAAGIASTFTDAARAAWRHIVPPERLDGLEPQVATWQERLRTPTEHTAVFVAVVEGTVVGFVRTDTRTDEPGVGYVDTLYARPHVWGSGIGRALLDAGVGALRAAGCREAVLWTEARNHRPRRVYEAYGWRADGSVQHRTFLDTPIIEVRYRLTL